MLGNLLKGRAAWLAAFSVLCSAHSHAQTVPAQQVVPYQEVHTVAGNTQAVPIEYPFQTNDADTYQVTLVDLGATLTVIVLC